MTRSIRCSFLTKGKRWTSHIVRERSIMSRDNGRQRVGRKYKQWFPQQQFNPLALKPDTKWTKARRLARINPWIWRFSKKKTKKNEDPLYKKGPLSAFEVCETCQPSSASLCNRPPCPTANHHLTFICRHLRGQLMPFRSTHYTEREWEREGERWWEGSSTCWSRDLTTV